ncbi:hypothetical protein B0J13DRAFT_663847 [Dactylonectria estremocensis]|uniref:EKC/KEOPS complex subunit BUD32 n=1 Tax=Dactylonectria estremocensis TaxID=1079267 RepID=A0A9P9CYD2_9HYPO|nr:hypothetical protein B0J13DRAFT_663847 [Dactylonectria estremocensis]
MNEDEAGFDPTIITSGGERYIETERDGQTENLIIDEAMKRAPCIAGRATTCWKVYRKEDSQTPLRVNSPKKRLSKAVNVARYYHHETVRVRGADDDVRSNVRKGLDVTKATNYRPGRPMLPPSASASSVSRKGRSSSAGVKRPSSETDARSASDQAIVFSISNKGQHRRAAKSAALKVTSPLHKAGFLHRDISINNLMINEDDENPSRRAFLIDLDLAIRIQREGASGAKGKTGTRAFMAIGALLGNEQHSFMHDLESFFWVLFWICIHCNEPDEGRVVPRFEKWNYVGTEELAELKKGQVSHEGDFIRTAEENFTSYYRPLTLWVNRLRKAVFPNGGRWEREDRALYSRMRDILQEARKDYKVLADR